ncbi:AraC family transcriptional regulator [Formosa sediminum]|uniref:AraC family transcriptional regulator n=1 Tax=Formosa sediminum TaxID=2594004 RepID=A0A516GRB7_9FLAO|nr:AraC family transcriptional regulator [Formosa sediminum]QDO93900.1 AraC family transcriptional regulator [Formosa sediminum]
MKNSDKDIHSDYRNRIDNVFKYIDEHLNENLSLELVSRIALYSPYHFHRVFKFVTQETLSTYVNRRRIEQAASMLIHKSKSISEIAMLCGFNDNSSFTRAFKKFYKISPTDFRAQNTNIFSKISQLESKNGQAYPCYEKYICTINNLKNWIKMNAKIDVKDISEIQAIGLTHIGVNGIEHAFQKLIMWANSKHLMHIPEAKVGRIFYNSFKITAAEQVRMSVFLTTKTPIKTEGEINNLTIEKGKCIVGHFEIKPEDFEKSWTGLFIWMNENGYQKSDAHPFEIYHNDFRTHPEHKCFVDLYIPIL